MKILPVNYNLKFHNNIYYDNHKTSDENSKTLISKMPSAYYSPVSFQCAEEQITLIKQLKSLKDMHCPLCAVKMLSPDEMNTALKDAAKLQTGMDMVKFLDKYEENINPNFSKIGKNISNKCRLNCNRPLTEIFLSLKEGAIHKSTTAFNDAVNKIDQLSKSDTFSDKDKQILANCKSQMDAITENIKRDRNYKRTKVFKHFNNRLKTAVQSLEYNDKNNLFKELNENVRDCFVYENMFENIYNPNELLPQAFVRNLLNYSKSDLRKVFDMQPANTNNLMLSCEHCEITNKSLKRSKVNPYNYYNHIYELSERALNGEISQDKTYPILLAENVRKNTYWHLVPDKTNPALNKLMQITGVKDKRPVELAIADIEGVSCACCGQKTITHEHKTELFERIKDAESIKKLADILDENVDVIRPKFIPLINSMNTTLQRSPNISEKGMLKNLRGFAYDELQNTMFKCISDLRKASDKFRINSEDRILVNEFVSKTGKMISSFNENKLFDYDEYRANAAALCRNLQTPFRGELWKAATGTILSDALVQKLLFPIKETSEKVGSPLKVAVQNIFSASVATVDHLDPKFKYNPKEGADLYKQSLKNKKQNLVVMCKDCNARKKTRELPEWVRKNPQMKQNLVKYLKEAQKLRHEGKIGAEYDNYPNEVLMHFTKLTHIRLKLDDD